MLCTLSVKIALYWIAEKVTKIKLVMILIKNFDKYHHLFNLHIFGYYFVFS